MNNLSNEKDESLAMVGWREWLALPELGINSIKAKVDTGARTSALHAFFVEPYLSDEQQWVRFGIHPLQNNTDKEIICNARVKDQRVITDSGGHKENRYVIETLISLGPVSWHAEMTLTDRDSMKFRMLLGRTALSHHFVVNPAASFVHGRHKKHTILKENKL